MTALETTSEDVQLIDMESNGNESKQHSQPVDNQKNDIQNDIDDDKPKMERQNTEQRHALLYFDALQIERYIRLICSCIFIGGSLIIVYILKEGSPYRNIAYCMSLVQILWLVQFLGVVLTMQHLHSIVVFRKVVPNTLFLVVPYAVKEYKQRIMSSISAMSSLRGSNLFYLLGSSSNICFGMTFSAVSFKWFEFQIINIDTVSLGLLLISTFGSTIITGWELDLSSKLSTGLHYLGALVSFVAAPTAFAMYQSFSALSIVIMVITYVCLAVFGSVYAFWKPEYPDDPVMVHRVSMFCIIVELIAVLNGMLCVILFIWCMDGNVIL